MEIGIPGGDQGIDEGFFPQVKSCVTIPVGKHDWKDMMCVLNLNL